MDVSTTVTFRTRGDGRLHGPGVTVSKAPNASVCEAPRCGESHALLRVDLADYGTAVRCSGHVDELLERERGW